MPLALAAAAAVVISLAVLLFSLDAIEQNEYGLKYNWITADLHEDVYHGGTHLIGFWNRFIVFPATVQTIEFSDRPLLATAPMLHTRTKEGLGLFLSISFQYVLEPTRIRELFTLTNIHYESLFERLARENLLEAASEYEGPQYWLEREEIGEHMRVLVADSLAESCARLWGLQLQVIDLPDSYEQVITNTQVQQQIVRTRENEQLAAAVRASTEVLSADYARQIQVVLANATANLTRQTGLAQAEAGRRKIAAEAEAVGYVRRTLGLSADDAVRYEQAHALTALPNATFMASAGGAETGATVRTAAAASRMVPAPSLLSGRPPQLSNASADRGVASSFLRALQMPEAPAAAAAAGAGGGARQGLRARRAGPGEAGRRQRTLAPVGTAAEA